MFTPKKKLIQRANYNLIGMAHIIDLKNRENKPQPTSGQDSVERDQAPVNLLSINLPAANARIISWSGQLHYHPNIRAIVIVAVIFFVVAAFVQIFQKNIITTVFFALIGLVILPNARRKPEIGRFEINPVAVVINNIRHTYPEMKSFWIEYDLELGIQELSLQLKKWYAPYVKIPIYGQNPVQLRLALLEFLPEVEHKDSLVEILSRKLGI